MDALTRIGWIGFIALTLAVSGCGGGGGGTQQSGTVVGAAGGTVTGPNGAKLEIPPGALTTDTTIAIAQIAASAIALPAGFTVSGQTFALTPEGTRFAAPVTLTLPFDPASVPAGTTPALFKTNAAQNQWEPVANASFGTNAVSAQITSFSDAAVVVAPLRPVQLVRQFQFDPTGGSTETAFALDGVLDERRVVGPPGVFDIPIDGDNTSALEVFSAADGLPFWVGSESGKGHVRLTQSQSFVKETDAATLEVVITAALVEALDFNGEASASECGT